MSLLDLRKKRGDLWEAATWNAHLEEIDRYLQNLGVTGPGGSARRATIGPIYLPLSVSPGDASGEWLLRVGYGLVGGLEPKIHDKRVSEVDQDTGDTPALTVTAKDFSDDPGTTGDWPKGVAFIYGVATFDPPSWAPLGAEIVARAAPWKSTPWKAARLIGLLQRDDPNDEASDVSPVQLTVFNQSLTLSKKSGSGLARYWWRAAG